MSVYVYVCAQAYGWAFANEIFIQYMFYVYMHVPHVKSYQASTYCVEYLMPERALAGREYNVNKECYSTVCTIDL